MINSNFAGIAEFCERFKKNVLTYMRSSVFICYFSFDESHYVTNPSSSPVPSFTTFQPLQKKEARDEVKEEAEYLKGVKGLKDIESDHNLWCLTLVASQWTKWNK